jgi:hypothetical protein
MVDPNISGRNGLSMMKASLNKAKLSPMPLQIVLVKKIKDGFESLLCLRFEPK